MGHYFFRLLLGLQQTRFWLCWHGRSPHAATRLPPPQAIAWSLNRGALCMQRLTTAQFLAVYLLPITPVANGSSSGNGSDAALEQLAPAPTGPAPAGPASAARRRSRAAGSADSLASSQAGDSGAAKDGALLRPPSSGRLGDDAGGSRKLVLNWAGKNVLLLATLALFQFPLPGFVEALGFGESQHCATFGWLRGRPGTQRCRGGATPAAAGSSAPSPCMHCTGCCMLCCALCSRGALRPAVAPHGPAGCGGGALHRWAGLASAAHLHLLCMACLEGRSIHPRRRRCCRRRRRRPFCMPISLTPASLLLPAPRRTHPARAQACASPRTLTAPGWPAASLPSGPGTGTCRRVGARGSQRLVWVSAGRGLRPHFPAAFACPLCSCLVLARWIPAPAAH